MKKQAYKQPKMVNNVIKNWKQMQGVNALEKKLNAFITWFFVTGSAPADECIKATQRITKLKNPTTDKIYNILKRSFGMGTSFEPGSDVGVEEDLTLTMPKIETQLRHGAAMIYAMLQFK